MLPANLCRSRSGRAAWLLAPLAAALLLHPLVLANPGFFSHDEWERLDHIRRAGLWDFLGAYSIPHAGPEFGHPVRPIGFVQQGFSALLMEPAPFLVHLLDVLMHGAVASLLALVLHRRGASAGLALLAGLLFAASPLTAASTGWVAASFDRWLGLFALLAAGAAWGILTDGVTPGRGLALAAAAAGAALSKEAAATLPLALLIVVSAHRALHPVGAWPWRRAASVLALGSLPVMAYLFVRLPAIEATLAGRTGVGYYAPTGRFLGRSLSGYWGFPFLPHLTDFPRQGRLGLPAFLGAGLLHAGLAVLAGRWFGWRLGALYVAAYFVFLLPVLPLREPGAHYLYASALPLAVLMAALWREAWRRRARLVRAALAAGTGLMLANHVLIQWQMHRGGVCQAAFLPSLDAALAQGGPMAIAFAPRSLDWVARRAIYGRSAYAGVTLLPGGAPPPAGMRLLVMGTDCRLR
ncbi:MAG: hypothetical protein JWR00_2374 [Rubritepida sp.]|nr:hypothetical protein [Rubritepida sp.]